MNTNLLKPDVQQYLSEISPSELKTLPFKTSPFEGVSISELLQQAEGRLRIEKKLPTWFSTKGIIFPMKLSLEQASSELTAEYKSRLIKGNSVLDITGGFGIDSYFFSKVTATVTHCELDAELSAIAHQNAITLGADNIHFYHGDGIELLRSGAKEFGTIYADPSRRLKDQKVFKLADCTPNVSADLVMLLQHAERVIIKTAPLLDITAGLKELTHVSEIHILSIKNDCKEILWVIDKGFTGEPLIKSVTIGNPGNPLTFVPSQESAVHIEKYCAPEQFLFEPDVAVLKAGAFKILTERYPVKKLAVNTHLYTAAHDVEDFPGKRFKINKSFSVKDFKKNTAKIQANVISRNFHLKPEEIRKKFKIADGGDIYLIFTTTADLKFIVIEAKLVETL